MATIDLVKIKLNGDTGGGGGSTTKLEEKTIAIVSNGTQSILPDEGFDGLSAVNLNVAISGNTSALDFSLIGYNTDLSAEINAKYNDDIAYSKTLYDNWNPNTIGTTNVFKNDTKLVYCPNIDIINLTSMNYMFDGCNSLTTIPLLDTSNVTTMVDVFSGCSSLTTIPLLNTSNVKSMSYMFGNCSKLTSIPLLDTSNVTTMSNMFSGCAALTTIPLLDTSNVTTMYNFFYNCKSLTTIPQFNTSNVTTMQSMFHNCSLLTTIPELDTSNVTIMRDIFNSCSLLTTIPLLDFGSVTNISTIFGYTNISSLTDLGGFKNLKIDWNDTYGLYRLPNLTYESVMNVINNLYDFRSNGDTTTTRTIKFNSNSKALLSDADIAIATNKGWIIS